MWGERIAEAEEGWMKGWMMDKQRGAAGRVQLLCVICRKTDRAERAKQMWRSGKGDKMGEGKWGR